MHARTFIRYLVIAVVGCAVGSAIAASVDAGGRFIPVRLVLRSGRLWQNGTGLVTSAFDRARTYKPVRVEVERGVSLLLDPGDLIGREILITGAWQPEVWQSISDGLPPGGVFLDVGAHIGYDSLKGSRKVGSGGRVISFEPNPRTLEQLRANIAASRATNVTVEPIACTDKQEDLTFYDSTSEGNSGASSLSLQNADETGRGTLPSYTVHARPIDDVVNELGLTRLDVMKVDVEGAEYLVLTGARKTLLRFHPRVIMEIVPDQLAHMNANVNEIVSLMQELGYPPKTEVDSTDWEWKIR